MPCISLEFVSASISGCHHKDSSSLTGGVSSVADFSSAEARTVRLCLKAKLCSVCMMYRSVTEGICTRERAKRLRRGDPAR